MRGFFPAALRLARTEPVLMPGGALPSDMGGRAQGKERPPHRPYRKGGLCPRPERRNGQGLKPCRPHAGLPA